MKRPGDDKITNTDEQEVAVNQSTKDVNGYDEPVSHSAPDGGNQKTDQKPGKDEKKRTDQQPHHYKTN